MKPLDAETSTIREVIDMMSDGRPGAKAVLLCLAEGQSVPAEPLEDTAGRDEFKSGVGNVMSFDTKVPDDVETVDINLDDKIIDSLQKPVIAIADYLVILMQLRFHGEDIENLYVRGAAENIIVLSMTLAMAVAGVMDPRKLRQAARGEYDLDQYLHVHATAAASMNAVEMDNDLSRAVGVCPLERLIDWHIGGGKEKFLAEVDAESGQNKVAMDVQVEQRKTTS